MGLWCNPMQLTRSLLSWTGIMSTESFLGMYYCSSPNYCLSKPFCGFWWSFWVMLMFVNGAGVSNFEKDAKLCYIPTSKSSGAIWYDFLINRPKLKSLLIDNLPLHWALNCCDQIIESVSHNEHMSHVHQFYDNKIIFLHWLPQSSFTLIYLCLTYSRQDFHHSPFVFHGWNSLTDLTDLAESLQPVIHMILSMLLA